MGRCAKPGGAFDANENRPIWRGADGTLNYSEDGATFRKDIPLCDAGSTNVYKTVYPDGVSVDRVYPAGVGPEETATTEAICESWRDAQGNAMSPGDPTKYPKSRLQDYRKLYPEVFGG